MKHADDLRLARDALAGDAAAASRMQDEYFGMVRRILMARGLNPTDASDLVADLAADCFGGRPGAATSAPLLEKFEGRSALSTWLVRAAWNRWLDHKRRDKFKGELPRASNVEREGGEDAFDRIPQNGDEHALDRDLAELMTCSIRAAFQSLPSETLLILKLVYVYRVRQGAIARIWNWDQSKVSRLLATARDEVEKATMQEVAKADPGLELVWEDFLELCQVSSEAIF